jgi:hypothetical protein
VCESVKSTHEIVYVAIRPNQNENKRIKKNSPRSDEIIAADCYDYDYYYVTCRSGSSSSYIYKSGRAILDRPVR